MLCRIKNDTSLGSAPLISEFEFTFMSVLVASGGESEFAAGCIIDKKTGKQSGKIIFSNCHSFSALNDLPQLCEVAHLSPDREKSKDTDSGLVALGFDSIMQENSARILSAAKLSSQLGGVQQPLWMKQAEYTASGNDAAAAAAALAAAATASVPSTPRVVASRKVDTSLASNKKHRTTGNTPSHSRQDSDEPMSARGPEKGTFSNKKKK